MLYLIYVSTSVRLMEQTDLIELLAESRERNVKYDITGMLLYSNGTFIQLLEGDQKDIQLVYSSIKKDPRHTNLIEIISGEEEKRSFSKWSMAFLTPDPEKMAELEGYMNPVHDELFKEDDRHTAVNVLRTFAQNNNLAYSQPM